MARGCAELGTLIAPGDSVLNMLAAQVHVAHGEIEAALPYAREGAAGTPRTLRPARQVYYARLLRRLEK